MANGNGHGAGNYEHKVEKVITDRDSDLVKAVLFRQVDPIGQTHGYIMHHLHSGEKVYHADPETLLRTVSTDN